MLYIWFFYTSQPFLASMSHGLVDIFLGLLMVGYPEFQLPVAQFLLTHSLGYFLVDILIRRDWP